MSRNKNKRNKTVKNNKSKNVVEKKNKLTFPNRFPFWARLKISKNRTTLVIDEERSTDKRTKREEDMFVHREATSKYHKGLEEIKPNPDKSKKESMYLKRPTKLPKRMFSPHNKQFDMPKKLQERYDKNNDKKQ